MFLNHVNSRLKNERFIQLETIKCIPIFFRKTLVFGQVMCPLLEHCGQRNLLVAHVALGTVESVADSCGVAGGLRGMVDEAVPHYWYPLSMQLKRPQLYPRAPQILQVRCGSLLAYRYICHTRMNVHPYC